jgi:hypothetical protein
MGFAIAFGVFTLVFALAPRLGGEVMWSGMVEAPVPRLVSNSEVYRVGESGSVWLEYHNPTQNEVNFTPPSMLNFHIEYAGDTSYVTTILHISWEHTSYTLRPGRSMDIYRYDFNASRPGDMKVVINGIERTVMILPRSP